LALDPDTKDGKHGPQQLQALQDRLGVQLPQTLVQRTPSGATHLIFRLPDGTPPLGNSTLPGCPHVDIRAHRGYIAAEGTITSVGQYQWLDWCPLEDGEPDIADAPQWLVDLLVHVNTKSNEPVSTAQAPHSFPAQALPGHGVQLQSLPPGLRVLVTDGVSEGQRSEQFHHAVGWLKDIGHTVPQVVELLQRHPGGIAQKFADRLQEEVERCWGKLKAGEARPRERGASPDSDVMQEQSFNPVFFHDLMENPPRPPQFVWEGLLPERVVTLFGAHGGTGKSMIGLMLAVAVAMGMPLFGIPTKRCKAIFLSLEDDSSVVRWRLWRICHEWHVHPSHLANWLSIVDSTEYPELFECEGRGPGETTDTFSELDRMATEFQAGLIVVDNASDAYGGDEIQRRQVRAFMRSLGRMAKRDDAAVMLLAHVDKVTSRSKRIDENAEGYSGSTAWHNSARSRLFMVRDEAGVLTIRHQKSNYGHRCSDISLCWPDDKLPELLSGSAPSIDALIDKVERRADDMAAEKLLCLLAEYEQRGQYCSPLVNSPSNPFKVLHPDPTFRRMGLRREDTARVITQCQRAGWIEPLDYQTKDRKWRSRWTVTPLGYARSGAVAPTAPTAPSSIPGATSAESAAPVAPSAPTGVGGTGGERAHKSRRSSRPAGSSGSSTHAGLAGQAPSSQLPGKPVSSTDDDLRTDEPELAGVTGSWREAA
jgi:hypothetical protein